VDSITLSNIGVDRVHKAKASSLKCEFDSLTFNDGESVDDFSACISRIVNQLTVLRVEYKEEDIVRQFLLALPPKFEQITASIKTLLNLETITIDELIGQLKPSDKHINRSNRKSIASLNLTKDELVVHVTSCLKVSGHGGLERSKQSSSSGSKCRHDRGKGRASSGGKCRHDRGKGRGTGGCSRNHGGRNTGSHSGEGASRDGGAMSGDVMSD
jgi:hypothetical protein